mgnify:CR=1 FL=1|tara:strand:+ start:8894 stop:9292 length:399 start_codon:yes stop_codon:yes gene_type:complete
MLVFKIVYKKAIAAIQFGYYYVFRYFTDEASVQDDYRWQLDRTIQDSSTVADNSVLSFSKSVSDTANTADNYTVSVSSVRSESLDIDEDVTFSISTSKSDTIGASDSGLIVSQDYCNINYFAADFVGESASI